MPIGILGIFSVKNMKFVICCAVMVLGFFNLSNSIDSTKLFDRSCSTCNEISTFVACSSAFALDWSISAEKLPTSSMAKPINNTANPIASNGKIRGWTYLTKVTIVRRLSFPNTSPSHLRCALFLPILTISSAASNKTPIITIPAPNQARAEKEISQVESFEITKFSCPALAGF